MHCALLQEIATSFMQQTICCKKIHATNNFLQEDSCHTNCGNKILQTWRQEPISKFLFMWVWLQFLLDKCEWVGGWVGVCAIFFLASSDCITYHDCEWRCIHPDCKYCTKCADDELAPSLVMNKLQDEHHNKHKSNHHYRQQFQHFHLCNHHAKKKKKTRTQN